MVRVSLIHDGARVGLAEGQTLIGRGLHCHLRFHDTSVSREHLLIVVSENGVTAHNLSATTGTAVNGRAVTGPYALRDGDIVSIGFRRLIVLIEPDAARGCASGDSGVVDQNGLADEVTRPISLPALAEAEPAAALPAPAPRCDDDPARVGAGPSALSVDSAGAHGETSALPAALPGSRQRRLHPREAVELPVLYQSDTLTIDASVRNISRGGVFIASELLDPVGTACELTLLPDGRDPVVFCGVVANVRAEAASGWRSGMGVQFTHGPAESGTWLLSLAPAP